MPGTAATTAPTLRQLLPFAALSASYFAHIGFFNPYLPLWLKGLGLDLLVISLLISMQSATRLFAPYIWGWLSDHTGERVKLLRYGASAALLVALGLWWARSPWPLAAVLLLMFTHTSGMMPMSEAAMTHLVSHGGQLDAKRYGRMRLCGSVGFLVTVFAAGAWFQQRGMADFPAWTVLTLVLVTLCTWWLPDTKEPMATDAAPVAIAPVLRQPVVRWFLASAFFHVLSHAGVYFFFSLYLDALGYSKTLIGVLWAVSVIVEIGWFFTQARWLPHLSLTGWLVLCSATMALRMGLTAAWADTLAVLLLAQALHAITFATHHTVCVTLLGQHFAGRLRGRGQALYTVVAYGLSGVLGGLAGGVLSQHYGLGSVFTAAIGISFVATGCAWRVHRLSRPVHGQ